MKFSLISSPLSFWLTLGYFRQEVEERCGGGERQASTSGKVEEVVDQQQPRSRTTDTARAQNDLQGSTPMPVSVQTARHTLCECGMKLYSRLVPCSYWAHVTEVRVWRRFGCLRQPHAGRLLAELRWSAAACPPKAPQTLGEACCPFAAAGSF